MVIAEPAGHARGQTGVVRSVKHTKELQLKAPIYASDRVVHHWHASFFRRLRIFPREILIDELSKASRPQPTKKSFPGTRLRNCQVPNSYRPSA
jgi:hypothetical protein